MRTCDHDGCDRPAFQQHGFDPTLFHRCGLHEIATYNDEELREWGEENAADMVSLARQHLRLEAELHGGSAGGFVPHGSDSNDRRSSDEAPHELTCRIARSNIDPDGWAVYVTRDDQVSSRSGFASPHDALDYAAEYMAAVAADAALTIASQEQES